MPRVLVPSRLAAEADVRLRDVANIERLIPLQPLLDQARLFRCLRLWRERVLLPAQRRIRVELRLRIDANSDLLRPVQQMHVSDGVLCRHEHGLLIDSAAEELGALNHDGPSFEYLLPRSHNVVTDVRHAHRLGRVSEASDLEKLMNLRAGRTDAAVHALLVQLHDRRLCQKVDLGRDLALHAVEPNFGAVHLLLLVCGKG